ncbi:MAG: hypothetical protein AB1488_06685 [Nitrospirota bacterium]
MRNILLFFMLVLFSSFANSVWGDDIYKKIRELQAYYEYLLLRVNNIEHSQQKLIARLDNVEKISVIYNNPENITKTKGIVPVKENTIVSVFFPEAGYSLSDYAKLTIKYAANKYNLKNSKNKVVAVGYSSPDGSAQRNTNLRTKRAMAIVNYLRFLGINTPIDIEARESNTADKERDRRAEIIIYE